MISADKANELLDYNPDTGLIYWAVDRGKKTKAGDYAGGLDGEGYIRIEIDGREYRAHRLAWLIMTGDWPEQVDHINHIRDDNRWVNLRSVTLRENGLNRLMRSDNTSGVSGVYWCKNREKWVARINARHKRVFLGAFDRIEDAKKAKKEAEIKYGYHENHGTKLKSPQ